MSDQQSGAPGPHANFPTRIQSDALKRQKKICACCGTKITGIGEAGRRGHEFGEGAKAHHVIPHKLNGPLTLENCVIICGSCHYSAHVGGNWRDTTIYNDLLALPMALRIARIAKLYPHYRG
jgi:hypothetical protein